MYQIMPYDLSENFKLIPYKEKFQLTLWQNNSVKFTSKRKALDFISKISHLFVEVTTLSEIVFSSIISFGFHLKPASKSKTDKFQIFYSNCAEIQDYLTELKFYQKSKCELYQIIRTIDNLLFLLVSNCKILNAKNNNCVLHHSILLDKITKSLQKVLSNPLFHFNNNSLTLFQ